MTLQHPTGQYMIRKLTEDCPSVHPHQTVDAYEDEEIRKQASKGEVMRSNLCFPTCGNGFVKPPPPRGPLGILELLNGAMDSVPEGADESLFWTLRMSFQKDLLIETYANGELYKPTCTTSVIHYVQGS